MSSANYLPGVQWSCDCSEEHGPCEDHGTVIVQREGASTRTADDLLLLFCEDAADVLHHVTGENRLTPWARQLMADAEQMLAANDHYGCRWLPETDDPDETRDVWIDALLTLRGQLECELATLDAPHFTYWNDGYWIVRVADDCPLLAY